MRAATTLYSLWHMSFVCIQMSGLQLLKFVLNVMFGATSLKTITFFLQGHFEADRLLPL